MTTARYMVAKYIPDVLRIEPRNIGVIVWSPLGVRAQFAAEIPDRLGELDGRSIPSFITSGNAYRQWIQFWRSEIEKPAVEPLTGGPPVPRSSPEFLDTLQALSKGNFVLGEGGFLLDAVSTDELPDVVEQLFDLLVKNINGDEGRDPTLDELCDHLIERAQLQMDPHFQSAFKVVCPLAKGLQATVETFEFSHAYKNGSLQRLYQRVSLSKRRTVLRKTVHDAAWMFQNVIEHDIITRDQGGVLVNISDEQRVEPDVRNALSVLNSVTRIINVSDQDTALHEFLNLSTLVAH